MKPYVRKTAIALRYEEGKHKSPIVTAKGKGKIAEKIIEKAKENQIPIHEDPSLVQMLSKLDIHDSIPEELYVAVAEVFAFIYQIEKDIEKNAEE
jgi:flagellar biosynthesis protein